MPKVSVIVPVYNAEKYIKECVESILNQTFSDLELILIDDGSMDCSGRMCDEYAEKDNRIRVVHQVNSGVSVARNVGLDIALGEYIAFVDSDDWIDVAFLEKCLEAVDETNCEVCIAGFHFYNENIVNSRKLPKRTWEKSSNISSLQMKELLDNCLVSNIWAKLYRRSSIAKTRFDTTANFGEDLRFCFEVINKDICITMIDWAGYYYRLTPNGLTSSSVNEKKCRSVVKTYQFLYNHAIQSGFMHSKEYMVFLDNRWCQDFLYVAWNIIRSKMKHKDKCRMLRLLMMDHTLCERINAMDNSPVSDVTKINALYMSYYKQCITTSLHMLIQKMQ